MKYELTDKTLYEICEEVTHGEDVSDLVRGMVKIMYEGKGVGLAANQVGDIRRVIIINADNFRKAIINPVITKTSKQTVKSVEGCLSFPKKEATIIRHKQITVEGFTPDWKPFKQKLRGLTAICVQHEVDHLNGITCIKDLK